MKQIYSKGTGIFMLLVLLLGLSSCGNDDDGIQSIPERDRTEQQVVDRDSLLSYFSTHYYNSDVVNANPNPTIEDLEITRLEEGESVPDGHTLLADAIETHNTLFIDVDYEYYILRINQGGGEDKPGFPDEVRVNYKGMTLDGAMFDSSVNSVVFDLTNLVAGWSRVLPQFNVAEDYVLNSDGTVSFSNAGVGVMFLPSGLAFFSGGQAGIPPYSNLLFSFELYQTQPSDHDTDGIPSFIEDLDEDLDLANDDTDGDQIANFVDADDDNDGVLTNDELEHNEYVVDTNMGEEEPVLAEDEYEVSRTVESGIITIKTVRIVDSNNDGLADYLDENIAINNNEDS